MGLKGINERTLSFWSWNDEISEDEIRLQINEFKKQGIGGFFIHSRAGLKVEYMSQQWLHFVDVAIHEAKENDLHVWLYDEDGWPSGFAGGIVPAIGEDYQQKILKYKKTCLKDCASENIIAVFVQTDAGYKKIDDIDKFKRNHPEQECICFFYEVNPFYADLLNADCVKYFIHSTHEIYYKYFGTEFGRTIQGIFTDEPQLSEKMLPWTFEMEKVFVASCGYSLIENLPLLVLDLEGYQKVRHDFWKTVSNLFIKSYTKQIYDWCTEHNILFTGHFSGEDGLCMQANISVDVMAHYEYMHVPGIDYLGKRITSPVLMKQVSSAARQLGKKYVLSETFGCSGWNISFKEMSWIWGWQSLLGVNLPCFHLSAYSIQGCRKRDYPPVFSYQEPWWDKFNIANRFISNLNQYLTSGDRVVDILVLHPMTSIWCENNSTMSSEMKVISSQFRVLSEHLLKLNKDFEYGNEAILEKYGKVAGRQLSINDKKYSTIILPQMSSLEKASVELLKTFVSGGGNLIVVNCLPTRVEGVLDHSLSGFLQYRNVHIVVNRVEMLEKIFKETQAATDFLKLYPRNGLNIRDAYTHVRDCGDHKLVFVWNADREEERTVIISLEGIQKVKQIDLIHRRETDIPVQVSNGNTKLEATISPYQCLLYKVEKSESNNQPRSLEQKIKFITGEWDIEPMDMNCLTIDCAKYAFKDHGWSRAMPVIKLQDVIYNRIEKTEGDREVTIRYEYYSDLGKIPERLYAVVEKGQFSGICINGMEVKHQEYDWWIDRGFMKIPLAGHVNKGCNTIDITYAMNSRKSSFNVHEVFETERNRFFYPVEFENLYIIGDMDVCVDGEICNETSEYLSVRAEKFTIADQTAKKTVNGLIYKDLWFYRGSIRLEKEITVEEKKERIFIQIPEPKCVYLDIYINDTHADSGIVPPFEVDITDYVLEGQNRICIEMMGSNRNVFGPHHHVQGENIFVGPSIFNGVKGWESFGNPELDTDTWTDCYNFVKFGFSEVPKIIYRTID